MIIDNHVHIFPDQGGPDVGPDPVKHVAQLQKSVANFWGRMVSSHTDSRFIPEAGEDVGFTVGRHGRYYWRKHGEGCWLQRGPAFMDQMESTPEQIIAHMDAAGVDMAVIQADYDYVDFDTGREGYFLDAVRTRPDRFFATAAVDYRLSRSDEFLEGQITNLTHAVEDYGFRALFLGGEAIPDPLDDVRCDPLWREAVRLGVPAYVNTGFCSKGQYLEQLRGLKAVLDRFPDLDVIDSHVGGNLRHPSTPEYTETPTELFPLFETGQFYLEVGYVLAYEDQRIWGNDSLYPYPGHDKIIQEVYKRFGPQMVWGSDLPWAYRTCTYQQSLDLVRLHTPYMTDGDRELVLGGNLSRLLT